MIKRFKDLKLKDNQRRKTVLIVESVNRLFISDFKDTGLKLILTAYAKEDKSIKVEEEISFIYPKNDSFN